MGAYYECGKIKDNEDSEVKYIISDGENNYRSNLFHRAVNVGEYLEVKQTSKTDGEYVKAGDTIEYDLELIGHNFKDKENLKKDEEVEVEVTVSDSIPKELSIDKVYVGNNEIKDYVYNINRKLTFKTKIKNGENEKIRVITIVNKQEDLSKDIEISNKFEILLNTDIYTTNNIINIMQKDKNINPDDPDNPINPDDPVKNEFVITGTAWCDENEDGIRNDNEKVLEGIPVYLYNVKTNKIDENYKEITDTNGKYKINVEKGEYLVLFDYDSSKYKLSKYKVEGAQESINSNVVAAKVSVNGEEKIYAVSDRIQITDKSAANINIGLIELKTLDIKLEKNIKRIVVQDSTNTIVYDYNDESLAKVELNAKKVAGTTIIVEYEIKVTNVGEVDAYIRKIKDFMPQDMIFKSELNKDWYLMVKIYILQHYQTKN